MLQTALPSIRPKEMDPEENMCYAVYISTDSPEDLAECNSGLVRFEKVADPLSDPCIGLLDFPHKWQVGSRSGCSCTFRHLHVSSVELGFSEPVDWYREEKDELEATRELYAVISCLLSSGWHVDLVDLWEGAKPDDIKTIDVSIEDVPERMFRMFENHRFRLRKENAQPPPAGLQAADGGYGSTP